MRPLVALLGLLLLTPAAHAQLDPQACGPIEATVALNPPGPLAPGETTEATVTVRNQGSFPASATVALLLSPEEGWTYPKDADPQVIPADGTGTFKFSISPTAAATGGAQATASATAQCQAPVGGLTCSDAACTRTDTVSFAIGYRAPEGLDIPFLDRLSFPPEYLVASLVLVGLVAAIALLARRPSRALAAECPEPLKLVRPGRGTSFPIEIRNAAAEAATARLEVGSVPEGWSAFMPLPDVQLAPRETRSLFLMVRAPEDALVGDAADVELTVRSAARPDKATFVRVRAEVEDQAPPA